MSKRTKSITSKPLGTLIKHHNEIVEFGVFSSLEWLSSYTKQLKGIPSGGKSIDSSTIQPWSTQVSNETPIELLDLSINISYNSNKQPSKPGSPENFERKRAIKDNAFFQGKKYTAISELMKRWSHEGQNFHITQPHEGIPNCYHQSWIHLANCATIATMLWF